MCVCVLKREHGERERESKMMMMVVGMECLILC